MDKTLDTLFTSDRLTKDIDNLMNSFYWIEALKSQSAKGLSEKLSCELNESQAFIRKFIFYTINIKRMKFRKILFNQTVASTHFNNDQSFIMNKLNEASIVLPKQFLIECAYLAILALNHYIGTSVEIQQKLFDWFPEIKRSSTQIKTLIESILNNNCCFKRVINFTKLTGYTNRPIILGKRQYVWSIDQNYLKSFIKYYYKMYDRKTEQFMSHLIDNESFMLSTSSSCITLPIIISPYSSQANIVNKNWFWSSPSNKSNERTLINLNDFNTLFYSWKYRLEQFKLLMQIKHNTFGFVWSDSISTLKKHNEFEFLKFNDNNNLNSHKCKEKRLKRHNKHQRSITNKEEKQEVTNQVLIQNQQEEKQQHQQQQLEQNTFDMIDETDYSYLKLKFDEKDYFDTFLVSNFNNGNGTTDGVGVGDDIFTSKSMFASLINDPFCQSFFNHNEINISQMLNLESGNETITSSSSSISNSSSSGSSCLLFNDDLAKLDLSLS